MRKEDLNKNSFIVLSLHRDDLIEQGYPAKGVNKLDDEQINYLAEKIGDALMDDYWEALEIGVESLFGLKKGQK